MNETPTLRAALTAFRAANGLSTREAEQPTWACRLGPFTLRFPNFAWRRRAIEAHDLHHVLTGTPCTLRGECRMAAWEFAAGRMPHWGAAAFCLPLVLFGALAAPQTTWRAFLAGRCARSLHGVTLDADILDAPLPAARVSVHACQSDTNAWRARLAFALLLTKAAALVTVPFAALILLTV